MQNKSFFIGLGLTALTSLVCLNVGLNSTFSKATAAESQPDKVTFFCREVTDTASGQKIPATIAWVPERKGHVRFIGWKSEYFNQGGWTPAERCQKVTQKFQEFYEQGRLNYLTYGKSNGYPIICGLLNQGETCNSNNQLFTVKSGSKPDEVIQRLMDISEGKSAEPILQSSGEQLYIPVQNFLNKSPLLDSK
ncbi:COP23 domain-containing protein [Nostoc sp. DedQUE05]|uniref:COP23 domain-containing protein n=1 Tax=Nostoc sp. DedQUE05 TaxID=3075391 RepID=UPI002AD521E6|nr:COP23 domain-containing protein [Nostoc sp. DedQUE05]